MRLMRCRVEEMGLTGPDFGLRIGMGQVVDFDKALSGTVTIGDAVAGREDCFEAVAPPSDPRAHGEPMPDLTDAHTDEKE